MYHYSSLTNYYHFLFQIGSTVINTRAENASPHCVLFLDDENCAKTMLIMAGNSLSYLIDLEESNNTSNILLNLISMYYTFDICYPALYGILKIIDDLCLRGLKSFPEACPKPPKRRRVAANRRLSRVVKKKAADCVLRFTESYFSFLNKTNVNLL